MGKHKRVRTTWDRAASAPPAMPSEDGGHPASYPEPGVDDYGTGGPSDWAEDPHPGPYTQSSPPATPSEDGDHPATKRARMELVAHYENKAMKALKLATALLGPNSSWEHREAQTMTFMDLNDTSLDNSISRMSEYMDMEMDEMGMDMEMDDMDEMEMLSSSPAFGSRRRAEEDEDDEGKEAETMLAQMLADDDEDEDDEGKEAETMLAQMLADDDEDEDDEGKEAETMLAQMLAEDHDEEDDEGKEAEALLAEMMDQNDPDGDTLDPEILGDYYGDDMDMMDPMGLMTESDPQGMDALVAEYFSKSADDDSDEEEEEEEDDKEAAKKAAAQRAQARKGGQRPQPRKPSSGPKSLGSVSPRTANSSVSELENLWQSAPDISDVFS